MSYARHPGAAHQRNEHDKIKRDLERKLRDHIKHRLGGVLFDPDNRHEMPWQSDELVQTEKQISGDLPSGKDYCRVDVAATLACDDAYAFEIKTSESDLQNWHLQRQDYRDVGLTPVLVTPLQMVYEIAPGHRLITRSDHLIAFDYDFYWQVDDQPPAIEESFETTAPYDKPPDHCPECGYKAQTRGLSDGALSVRCKFCGWSK